MIWHKKGIEIENVCVPSVFSFVCLNYYRIFLYGFGILYIYIYQRLPVDIG